MRKEHTMMKANATNFRFDINGLRAWAVVSVVLFHFGIAGMSGGFIGVDVFFVISGFLMTGIIIKGLERNDACATRPFSILGFYLSRARRIMPALLGLCLVLTVAGWFVLPSLDYEKLGKHVLSALTFVSNIVLWREDGYFDSASRDKLLLHTWSLSVEWQFYLLLPVMMALVWKIRPGRKTQLIAIAAALLASLLLCVLVTPIKPVPAFYLLPTRAWEMLAGGVVFLLARELRLGSRQRRLLEASGFALVIGSCILFDEGSAWPGWRALVPVMGAMLILAAARQSSIWTATPVAQWLGNCSYSLYLWHWPVVVALNYLQLQEQPGAIAIGLLASLILGALSYRLVEQSASRILNRMRAGLSAVSLAAASLALLLPGLAIAIMHGIPGRLPGTIEQVFNAAQNINPRRDECLPNERSTAVPRCTYGGAKLGAIVVGDSHAAALVRAVERSLPSTKLHILDMTMSHCPTIAGIKSVGDPAYTCGGFVSQVANDDDPALQNSPVIIINRTSNALFGPNEPEKFRQLSVPSLYLTEPFASRSPEYLETMREGIIVTACALARHRQVYMLRPIPELKVDVPKTMGRALLRGEQLRVSISLEEYHQRNAFAWRTQDLATERCGVKILDPLPYLCRDGRCYGDRDGQPIYSDDDHMNERGGDLLTPLFRQVFDPVVSAQK